MVVQIQDSKFHQAQEQLHQILQNPVYHVEQQPDPWWIRLLHWLSAHIHFSLSHVSYLAITWSAAAIVAVILAAIVLWWYRATRQSRMAASTVFRTVHSNTSREAFELAFAAYQKENYLGMLDALVDACLLFANTKGWAQLLPHMTLRSYSRQFRTTAPPSFTSVFGEVSGFAEQVFFNQMSLTDAEAERLLSNVRQVVEEKFA